MTLTDWTVLMTELCLIATNKKRQKNSTENGGKKNNTEKEMFC